MVVVSGEGILLGHHMDSAAPSEVKLIETTFEKISVPRKGRERLRNKITSLIYDKAEDSDPLRERLKKREVDSRLAYPVLWVGSEIRGFAIYL